MSAPGNSRCAGVALSPSCSHRLVENYAKIMHSECRGPGERMEVWGMKIAWRRWTATALGAAAVGVVALGATGADAQGTARVRVVHMSPDAPAVDVLVDGQRAISNLAFKSATD